MYHMEVDVLKVELTSANWCYFYHGEFCKMLCCFEKSSSTFLLFFYISVTKFILIYSTKMMIILDNYKREKSKNESKKQILKNQKYFWCQKLAFIIPAIVYSQNIVYKFQKLFLNLSPINDNVTYLQDNKTLNLLNAWYSFVLEPSLCLWWVIFLRPNLKNSWSLH